jgi:hypothetical protein
MKNLTMVATIILIGSMIGFAIGANIGYHSPEPGPHYIIDNAKILDLGKKHEYVSYREIYYKHKFSGAELTISDGDKWESYSGKTAITMLGTEAK